MRPVRRARITFAPPQRPVRQLRAHPVAVLMLTPAVRCDCGVPADTLARAVGRVDGHLLPPKPYLPVCWACCHLWQRCLPAGAQIATRAMPR